MSAQSRRWLGIVCRMLLGLAFLYAAIPKIEQPPDFAKEVAPYGLLPASAVGLVAIYLPWLELVTALALLTGLWSRTAAAMAAGMLLVFMAAIGLRMARGETSFECGCAGSGESIASSVPILSDALGLFFSSKQAWATLVRDGILLLLALPVLWAGRAPDRT